MNERIESLKGKLVVSCQALSHEPLHSAFTIDRMALAAKGGRAYGIHTNTREDTTEVQTQVDLPVIGTAKRGYEGGKVYITPTMRETNELMEVKPETVALGATGDLRPGDRTLDELYRRIRKDYPGQLLMADCSTVEGALHIDQLGFDFIRTTLVGYTDQSRNLKIESDDFEIIRRIMATMKHRVIAKGNINTPEKAKRVIRLGTFSMAVGSIITKPQLTTKSFAQALDQYRRINRFIVEGAGQVIERRSKIIASLEKYKGVIPIFYAYYGAEGNVSLERVRALAEYRIRKGIKGVYVDGSSGEYIYQSLEDRKITLEDVMVAAKGGLMVIAHVGCNNTKGSVELARHAESLGVDTIASIPPIYFHLPEYAIAAYWNTMSQTAPNAGFIIYNIPQLAGMTLTQSLLAEMRKSPRVIGVRNPSMLIQDIQMFKLADRDGYIIFSGPGEQFISGRVIGAGAGIGGTYGVMPELFLKMDELVKAGKMEEAMRIQYAADDIIYKMYSGHGNMYDIIKEMLHINGSLNLGKVREPLPRLVKSDLTIAQEAARMVKEAITAYC